LRSKTLKPQNDGNDGCHAPSLDRGMDDPALQAVCGAVRGANGFRVLIAGTAAPEYTMRGLHRPDVSDGGFGVADQGRIEVIRALRSLAGGAGPGVVRPHCRSAATGGIRTGRR